MSEAQQSPHSEKVVPTGGCYDCGGRCVIKVHIKDGKAVRVETDDGDEPQLRACARGRALRQQVYSPQRLRFPLKRGGARGEAKFERISWEEALDTVAGELLRIKEKYGPEAILLHTYSGQAGMFHSSIFLRSLLSHLGGYTSGWGGASAEASVFASRATYGTLTTGNTRDDLVNSRLIILWGVNPAESIYGTNTSFYLVQAKEAGAKIVVVDPRYTATVATFADEWIPIRPGTDAAMMIAMAYVIIEQDLHDKKFLSKYTVGWEEFEAYVTGREDGIAKSPSWAEDRTGVPAAVIASLAREYATAKPAALIPGYAPGRTAYGEQYHRAASVLAAMTGNVGISGGGAAGFERAPVGPMVPPSFSQLKEGTSYQAQLQALDIPRRLRKHPHFCNLWDAVLEGKAGGYPSDIKMAYIAAANPLNQFPNVNKGVRALNKLEFIVVHEQFMTATARFADILLPVTTIWERNDFARAWLSGPYFLYLNKVIEPLPETKSDFEICRELAKRLGIHDPLFDLSEGEGIRQLINSMGDMVPEIPDLEKFQRDGVHKIRLAHPAISFEKQIKQPEQNPFPTPSGKIEIYCQRLSDLNSPYIPPIPKYIEPWEGPNDPLRKRYPLQLISFHHKARAHSCFYTNPWLQELEPQSLWINTRDAEARNIKDNDQVRVFNSRGEVIITAKVTERIMPGVVALGEGAWYCPDEQGRDWGGNPNVLTRDHYAPGGGFPFNSCLVEVEKLTPQ
jgi:anaerobic dimethyl sulfoxide reductase subunit A